MIDQEMSAPSFWDDSRKAQALVQERADLARTVGRFKDLAGQAEDLRVLWEMATEAGDESETPGIEQALAALQKDLEAFSVKIVLSGPQDRKNVILSIHPGAGGTESQDWAQMLTRMYLRWAERAGFKAEVVDLLPGEEAGIKSATIEMTGEYAYGYLKSEIGVHRLIRISPFDASKRRHTSFASVSVIPEVEDVEVVVKDEEHPHRRVPLLGTGRSGRQYRGLGRPDHTPAERHRGRLPERALAAPQPGHGYAHSQVEACTRSTRRSSAKSWPS